MNYEELVEALRLCGKDLMHGERCRDSCPYGDIALCIPNLKLDAAAAIEELQSILTEADKKQAYQHDYICELVAEKEELQAETERLQAQLPKRGKWKVDMSHFSPHIVCSVCGVEIPCVAGWCMDAHMNYCPNCGAKMEVRE